MLFANILQFSKMQEKLHYLMYKILISTTNK